MEEELVRLVRACGSKQCCVGNLNIHCVGQARKSLWIETIRRKIVGSGVEGQARKSLWIETFSMSEVR